ncbi:MAG: hypothetical protein K9N38_02055 [Candidatus Marinimicrobia bacterium]|nr:hypothetical protein [Candidatus Neomarinimicrobiota bacterium]
MITTKNTITVMLIFVSASVFASNIGGFTGSTARLAADPLAAGTGGITLFQNSSTNSYASNPASQAFLTSKRFDASLVDMSLGRYLYTTSASVPLPPTAQLSVGLFAAGTKDITARDSRGIDAGKLSDGEITYSVSFSNQFSDKLAIGISLKLLTRSLKSEDEWFDLSGSGFGAGVGALYTINDRSTVAMAIRDWNSSYKWKTQDLFDQGSSYKDEFPMSLAWGWMQELNQFTLAIEHDHYFAGEEIFRTALLWHGIEGITLHTGFSYEDAIIIPGVSARFEKALIKGLPMHIDIGLINGIVGEGIRTYMGWGMTF